MIRLDELLSKVTQKEIMEFYWGERLVDNKPIYKNPYRPDRKGTCYFKWYNGNYRLIDHAREGIHTKVFSFNAFDYVMREYNCGFSECLIRINNDMQLGITASDKSYKIYNKPKLVKQVVNNKVSYKVVTRDYVDSDYAYWNRFGISKRTLRDFKVMPVYTYHSNSEQATKFKLGYTYNVNDPCYVYCFSNSVKLYRPYRDDNKKWKSNTTKHDIYGLDLLPVRGSVLFIASGCKDAMCLYEMGFDVIAPQSENTEISIDLINKLKKSFGRVIYLYDNDETGIRFSNLYAVSNQCEAITLTCSNKPELKDVAELVECYGLDYVSDMITDLVNKQMNNSNIIKVEDDEQKYNCTTTRTTTNKHVSVERTAYNQ